MNDRIKKAYAEVFEIFQYIDEEHIDKIPRKFIKFISEERDAEYIAKINPNQPLEEQDLMEETINILALLKLDYWCNEEERQELLNILKQNENEYQEELRKKYNPDNIFKNKTNSCKEKSLAVTKEKNFMIKLFENIKKMFKSNIKK